MMPPNSSSALEVVGLLRQIGDAAVRAFVLGGAVGLTLALLRPKRAAVRLSAWTIVLYAALAMPLLDRAVPTLRWPLPILASPGGATEKETPLPQLISAPASDSGETGRSQALNTASLDSAGTRAFTPLPVATATTPSPRYAPVAMVSQAGARVLWQPNVLPAIYLAGVLVLLLRAVTGWVVTKRLRRSVTIANDPALEKRMRICAHAVRLKRLPQLAESELALVPLTLSFACPTIILPASWRGWDSDKLDSVLAHELAHIERGDLLTQRFSLIYRAFFWFSPLAWWLHHHLAELAERASDESALEAGANQTQYASTLLSFFAEIHKERPIGAGRARWQGLAMARSSGAGRRVERILSWKGPELPRPTKWATAAMAFLALPVILLSASVQPSSRPAIALATVAATAPTIVQPSSVSQPTAAVEKPDAIAEVPSVPAPSAPRKNAGAEAVIPDAAGFSSPAGEPEQSPAGAAPRPSNPPQTQAAPDLSACGGKITRCTPLELNLIDWLKDYANQTTFEVISDKKFGNMILAATPPAVFHFGADMMLSDAVTLILHGPAFPVQLRDGRYLMISAERSARGGGESFYWFDLQRGMTFGGVFFRPSNGEPTPSLTVFSGQVADRITSDTQLPRDFLRDLETWRTARNVPAVVVRYFVNGLAWKAPLLHESDACAAAGAGTASAECQAVDEQAAELDMQAALYLLRSRYAEGTPAATQLDAAQAQWQTSLETACAGKADAPACRAQMARQRAQDLVKTYSQTGDSGPARPAQPARPNRPQA